jgi:phosphoribosylamine--glycine ligase
MQRRGTPFSGLLYVGLALTGQGPKVVEFNVRFGDPETQAVLALLRSPLTGVLRGTVQPEWAPGAAVTVVLAAEGYPVGTRTGDPIEGLAEAAAVEGVAILHAGTAAGPDGSVVSAGGRVLSVTAQGSDLAEARERAYRSMSVISLRGSHFRTDIGAAAASGVRFVP